MNKVEMYVDGSIYTGWTSVRITRSLKAVAGAFKVTLSNNWVSSKKGWIISPGSKVVIKIDGQKVITGFVDDISSDYDGESRSISVSGRDKTCDLVDCSYTGPNSLEKISIQNFIKQVIAPFGLNFRSEVSLSGEIDEFKAQQGEKVFAFLERALRLRGLMLTSNVDGELVISNIGQKRANHPLVEGINILKSSFTFDAKDRYSEYIVKGQNKGSEEFSDEQINTVSAKASDSGVKRFRPLVIMAESSLDEKLAMERAKWEAQGRKAKSSVLKVGVKGWKKRDLSLWFPNEIVPYKDESFGFDLDLLITEVSLVQDQNGTSTEMTLENKDAYVEKKDKVKPKRDIWEELNPQ